MRCRSGDLAMVMGGTNHGALCTVIEPYDGWPDAWACEALQGMVLASPFDPVLRPRPAGVYFATLDRHLLPMRGDPDAYETVRDIIEEVSA